MIDEGLIKILQYLEKDYCWSIGSGVIHCFECSIWERLKWRNKGRVVINAHGDSFNDAIRNALKGLEERGPKLKLIAER